MGRMLAEQDSRVKSSERRRSLALQALPNGGMAENSTWSSAPNRGNYMQFVQLTTRGWKAGLPAPRML
ncbi:MAG: hypothetical protein DMG46_12720 [Acidobacteria bacterium]|nr:MAG: hypothetical protein DMG46_12720 [Acidobacteriota bacterium]